MARASAPVRVVLCGLGKMGQNHARLLGEMEDARLVAVADLDAARAEALAGRLGVPAYRDLAEALDAEQPDAVIISASTAAHAALAEVAIARGLGVLVEKPLARSSEEGRRLCALAEEKGVFLMVGHVERFNPGVVAARRLIAQGDLGEVVNISTRRVGGSPADLAAAGDVLVDLAVHDVDLVHFLTGAAPRLSACTGHFGDAIDSATLLLEAGSVSADLHVNWLTPVKIREVAITGTEAFLSVQLIPQKVVLTRKNQTLLAAHELTTFYFDDYIRSFAEPDQINVGITPKEPLKEELRAFLHCFRNGLEPPVPARDALLALEVAEAARLELEGVHQERKRKSRS